MSFAIVIFEISGLVSNAKADSPAVEFLRGNGRITVAIDGLPVAVYCYQDDKITRPFFAHVRAPSGVQVTRHHPPIEGQDIMDHDTFHPGIWMSFGDISGSDYWRIKARVRQAKLVEEPRGGLGEGSFAVHNEYLDQKDPSKIVCNEVARYTFLVRSSAYLLLWDSTFSSDTQFYFGDQEEMGLGFRVATPLRVGASGQGSVPAGNGKILDSEGRKNEKQIWGNSAKWCDFSGTMAGQHVGMTIFCHPDNLRPSWFHARDYGLLEANQFGRKSFGKGGTSKVDVRPGEKLRIRYGVLIHSGPQASNPNLAAAYEDYLHQAGSN
jgi:methane monooxygenase PmoA-like